MKVVLICKVLWLAVMVGISPIDSYHIKGGKSQPLQHNDERNENDLPNIAGRMLGSVLRKKSPENLSTTARSMQKLSRTSSYNRAASLQNEPVLTGRKKGNYSVDYYWNSKKMSKGSKGKKDKGRSSKATYSKSATWKSSEPSNNIFGDSQSDSGFPGSGSPGSDTANHIKLEECQGDCDSDWHCEFGLNCFHRSKFQPVPGCHTLGIYSVDYCYRPLYMNELVIIGTDFSSPNSKAGECQGHCLSDGDCLDGLKCMIRSQYEYVPGCFGFGAQATNYCYDPLNVQPNKPDGFAPDETYFPVQPSVLTKAPYVWPPPFPSPNDTQTNPSITPLSPAITQPVATITASPLSKQPAAVTSTAAPTGNSSTQSPAAVSQPVTNATPPSINGTSTGTPGTGVDPDLVVVSPYFIGFVSANVGEGPTTEEYNRMLNLTEQYYLEHFKEIYKNNSTVVIENIDSTLTETGINLGIPEPRYNIYMEFRTDIVFGKTSIILPVDEIVAELKASIGPEYILDWVRQIKGSPFETVTEVIFDLLPAETVSPAQ